jgi:FkbM family methyltransferase
MLSEIVRSVWPANKATSLRKYVARARFGVWRTYSRLAFGETRWVGLDDRKILVRTEDFRAYRIAIMKGTQKAKVDLWKKMASASPDVCVDVGANYGEFSAAIADTGLPIIAVEANPKLALCLKASFAAYHNVTIVNAAASDSAGTASIFFNRNSSGSSSMSKEVAEDSLSDALWGGGGKQVEEEAVPSVRLDHLIPETLGRSVKSMSLKIDVEGFEELVIRGVMPLLKNLEWWRALVEFNPRAIRNAGSDPAQVWGILRGFAGIIVGSSGPPDGPFSLDATLPDTPTFFCDVIVGQGRMPAPAISGQRIQISQS